MSSIPSPADLARRPAPKPPTRPTPAPAAQKTDARPPLPQRPKPPLTAAEAIAPGKLTKREHFRKTFLFGLRVSRMTPHARLVGHDLLWRASHATGRLSTDLQPTTESLAKATGLTVAQVQVALSTLRSRGWLKYHAVEQGRRRAGTPVITLTIPAAVLEHIRASRTDREQRLGR
ncbi:hypothetical protein ACFSUJ_12020 [Streptomyces lusitanus]|uniref:Uncharacterized protein n=1 Tax=Streptomyces lusitanus TaxID=68232 RepID=A0ABU3JP27_9ACTN|nr:hypothetical protein [Streptomyces lusitanus]